MSDKQKLFAVAPQAITLAGEKFTIRQLRVRERKVMLKLADGKDDNDRATILAAFFLGNENGDRVFGDDQIQEIGDMPIQTILDIVNRGNAFNFATEAEKKT